VLIIALVVLVAMTLAAVALVRSVDTSNVIAGNLAFQQAATHSADTGIETAIAWLQSNSAGGTLDSDSPTNGYAANGSDPNLSPAANVSWDSFWHTQSARVRRATPEGQTDSAGNVVHYAIDRLCRNSGAKTAGASCSASPVVQAASGNAEEAGDIQLYAPSVVYYRITVRVAGPRNTVSYVQAVVSI
jgi:Tfp pilus assembly protein PilX